MEILWVVIGGAVLVASFRAGREFEREEAKRGLQKQEQDERDLQIIGPISLGWAAGELNDEEAEREVRRCCITRDTPLLMWKGMSRDEKMDLAAQMVRLSNDPVWQAQQEKSHRIANELRAQMGWPIEEQPTPMGGQA